MYSILREMHGHLYLPFFLCICLCCFPRSCLLDRRQGTCIPNSENGDGPAARARHRQDPSVTRFWTCSCVGDLRRSRNLACHHRADPPSGAMEIAFSSLHRGVVSTLMSAGQYQLGRRSQTRKGRVSLRRTRVSHLHPPLLRSIHRVRERILI